MPTFKYISIKQAIQRSVLISTVAWLSITVSGNVNGATITWGGSTGGWATGANWGSGSVPGASDRANVYTGVAQIDSNVGSVDRLILHGPGKVELNSGGVFSSTSEFRFNSGGTGASEFEINGGTLNVDMTGGWRIGNKAAGTLTLNSGSVLVGSGSSDAQAGVGANSDGIININGGLWDLDGNRNMVLGNNNDSKGTLNLLGGDFRERDVRHDHGQGTVNILGSAHTQIKVRQFNFETDAGDDKSSEVYFKLDAGGITTINASSTIKLSNTTLSVGFMGGYDGSSILVGDTFDLIHTTNAFEDAIGVGSGDFQMANTMPVGYDFTSEIFIDPSSSDEILRITVTEVPAVPEPSAFIIGAFTFIGAFLFRRIK